MPKKLNVHPNQRVDIPDYVRGASGYTQDSLDFLKRQLFQSQRALVASGFRVEISDQTASPGEITVYNGHALNRDGQHLNNEDQINTALTTTLSGPSTDFYLEVEFVESESDTDARAFWDPTYVNGGSIPPGREFTVSVSTRLSSSWSIVTPVSTTGFESTTDPNSNKIPLAVISTDPAGEITGAVNTGLVEVAASSNIEEDVAALSTKIRLLDTTLFADSGTITVGVGTAAVEAGITIVSNDRANGILNISPLVSPHTTGDIVRMEGTGRLVQERTDGVVTTGHPDRRRKLFAGDEYRGSAVLASKETLGERADTDMFSLKDYVDSVACTLHEFKYGSTVPGVVDSDLPPLSAADWTDKRWYSQAGNLQGAKTFSVTIGDGVASLGDLNLNAVNTDLGALLQEAHDGMDGTLGGSVFVKRGTYTIASSLTIDRPFRLEFDEGTDLTTDVINMITVVSTDPVDISGMYISTPTSGGEYGRVTLSSASGATLRMRNCLIGHVYTVGVTTQDSLILQLHRVTLLGTEDSGCLTISTIGPSLKEDVPSVLSECTLNLSTGAGGRTVVSGCLNDLQFRSCDLISDTDQLVYALGLVAFDLNRVVFSDCSFTTNASGVVDPILLTPETFGTVVFERCDFTGVTADATSDGAIIKLEANAASLGGKLVVTECDFSQTAGFVSSTSFATRGSYIFVNSDLTDCIVTYNKFGQLDADTGSNLWRVGLRLANYTGDTVFAHNKCRYFFYGIEGVSTNLRVLNNEFVIDSGSTAITDRNDIAISAVGSKYTLISGNYIFMEYDVVSTGFNKTAINMYVYTSAGYFITNNYIERIGSSEATFAADVYGIKWSGLGSGTLRGQISNNTIRGIEVGDDTATCSAIYFNDNFGLEVDISVNGNNIEMSTGGDAARTAIEMAGNSGEASIINNRISFQSLSGLDWTAIKLGQSGVFCRDNHIESGSSTAMPGSSEAAAITVTDLGCQVVNNHIDLNVFNHGNVGIYVTNGDDVLLDGNYINGSANQDNAAILISNNGLQASPAGLRVINNRVYCRGTTATNIGLLMILFGGESNSPVTVTGNQFTEVVYLAGREMVSIIGGGGTVSQQLNFSHNSVKGACFLNAGNRTVPCIDIDDMKYTIVSSNMVFNWASDADNVEGIILGCDSVDVIGVTGNVFQPGPNSIIGNYTISISNSDTVSVNDNVVGETGTVGQIVTSGCTNAFELDNNLGV